MKRLEFYTDNCITIEANMAGVMELHNDEKLIYIIKKSVLGLQDNRYGYEPIRVLQNREITYIFYMNGDIEESQIDLSEGVMCELTEDGDKIMITIDKQ